MSPALAYKVAGPPPRTFLGVEHSLTGKRWAERLTIEGMANALAMAQRHEIPDIVARVLAGRGVLADDAPAFLSPSIRALMPDPASLTDMDKAAARIADAIVASEKIAIFGDYDVDGASSSALLARFLRHQGLDPHIYIPDRLFEGYGPNVEAMKSLAALGAKLVVCVDCGSTSFDALEAAQALGLSVVVIDHHEVGVALPVAEAVVNPNRQDDLSGLGYLAAVGVTYLAIVAVNRQLRLRGVYATGRIEPDLLAWLDLVALGTICDVVPLVGLNRALVSKGMLTLAHRENRGIAALADVARIGGPIAPYHLAFLLGPRINAGGRIGDAALGARLLVSDDPAECERIAVELDRLNQERQAMEAAMVEEAVAEAEAEIGPQEAWSAGRATGTESRGPAVVVTASARWHPGVVGLIASRLKDRFQRPAIAIAFRNETGTGSGRSIVGVDLGHAVRTAVERGILIKGGGHAMAAGLTIQMSRLGELRAFFETMLHGPVAAHDGHHLDIDAALSARGASVELIESIEKAGPFGAGHPEPVFVFPNHRVAYADLVGNGHLRMTLASADGAMIKAMLFRAVGTPLGDAIQKARGQLLHVAGTLSVDAWQERRQPSLRVLDAAEPVTP
ncbi:MAG: single-stranded-DNA-specific exonuclease RecJ [Bauldia sp.]